MTDPQTELDIDAAEAQAALYDGDDRACIKTDVMNNFYAGMEYARKQSNNAAIIDKAKFDGLSSLFSEKVAELDALREELNWVYGANRGLGELMHGVCDALKGAPRADLDMSYTTHDLHEWATKAAAVANAALQLGAPGIVEHMAREDFVRALAAWRALFAQQVTENAMIAAELKQLGDAPP